MTRRIFPLAIATSLLSLAPECRAVDATLLDRAGQKVQQFWEQLSSVTCVEHLEQEKLNDKGKTLFKSQAAYDYLISMNWTSGELLVDEQRTETSAPAKRSPQGSLLATRGFATLLLILHPEFQPGYYFSPQTEETVDGKVLVPVTFVPRAGGKSPGALELKGREFPIAWEGTAWIDAATGIVVRIGARWKEPPEEIGLKELSTDVRYSALTLRAKTYWLPRTAEIDLQTPHQHWRNRHSFDNYKLFSVEADTKVEDKK